MSMKVALVVALMVIHLDTAATKCHRIILGIRSTDCDYNYKRCENEFCASSSNPSDKGNCSQLLTTCDDATDSCDGQLMRCFISATWRNCSSVAEPNPLSPADCLLVVDKCNADQKESARMRASTSTGALIKRNVSSSEIIAGCNIWLDKCRLITPMFCNLTHLPCSTAEKDCSRIHQLCTAGNIESAQSEAESKLMLRRYHVELKNFENPAACDTRLKGCLKITSGLCSVLESSCSAAVRDCHRIYDLCKGGRQERGQSMAQSKESSSSAFEIDCHANENLTADGDNGQTRSMWEILSFLYMLFVPLRE